MIYVGIDDTDMPDDLTGPQEIETLRTRCVKVRSLGDNTPFDAGTVDVGKHLRPSYRKHQIVLFARPAEQNGHQSTSWEAVRIL